MMNCLVCKKEMKPWAKKFCSKQCQGVFNKKQKKKCISCDNELNTGEKYCSQKCRDQSYQKIVSFTCEQCNKNVSGASGKTQAYKRRFCSQECVLAWKRIAYRGRKVRWITVNCDNCGKQLEERKPSKINKKNYCNKVCKGKAVWNEQNLSSKMVFKSCFAKTSKGIVKFRSMWEAAFVIDFLDKNNINWEYEARTFKLNNGHNYTPDFYIIDDNSYIEIKGFDKSNSIEKVNIFRKDFDVSIILANEEVLKTNYQLNLNHRYLKTICTTKEGQPLSTLSS